MYKRGAGTVSSGEAVSKGGGTYAKQLNVKVDFFIWSTLYVIELMTKCRRWI